MAETTILNGNLRTNTGKGFARASRRAGRIPAIIYGEKQDTISIDIGEREYKKIMTQSGIFSRLLDLNIDGKGKYKEVLLDSPLWQHVYGRVK